MLFLYYPFYVSLKLVSNNTHDDDINVGNNGQSNNIQYSDNDDVYGQTREIILFAERGELPQFN